MAASLGSPQTLASVRFQETNQQPDESAKAIVDFLERGPGHVVDTSETPDATRELLVLGYVIDQPGSEVSSDVRAV